MAKVKATISFAGIVSMTAGETGEIKDKAVLDDLLKAGYVKEIKEPAKKKGDK